MYRFASSPLATSAAFVVVLVWLLAGPRLSYSTTWQLVMTTVSSIVTFLMVFVLNHAQNRDTLAVNAKLDALIMALESADNRMVGLEHRDTKEASAIHEEIKSAIEGEL
ncbi:MAG: hypothetical protein DLM50_06365 [Candidatus Meridianibacter frigidus]|nr:MAG: hypothetical protein DLM50_06365 [Candidatus Eremiobacteraeota bacterium]